MMLANRQYINIFRKMPLRCPLFGFRPILFLPESRLCPLKTVPRKTMPETASNIQTDTGKTTLPGLALSLLAVVICTLAGQQLRGIFSDIDIIMVYLVGAVMVAASLGQRPAVLYSLLSVTAFNYFFVEPLYTFNVYNPSYWLTFAVMLLACLVISTQAARLREQVVLSRRREHGARMLYVLTKDLAETRDRKEMNAALLRCLRSSFLTEAHLWHADDKTTLKDAPPEVSKCFQRNDLVESTARTDGDRYRIYMPLRGLSKSYGVLEVSLPVGTTPQEDQKILLQTQAGLLAGAIERAETADAAERARLAAEREKMHNTLLSSVSHDFRSPLAAIAGAAEALSQSAAPETAEARLLSSIRHEARRLTRIVNNLLDITRIEGGHLRLRMQPYDPAEIIGNAIESSRGLMKNHPLTVEVASGLPFVRMDGLLISQVLQNLLENASRHTPAGTQVTLKASVNENGLFVLMVEDNGAGIPAGHERDIFSKFATYDHGNRPKGAGLGLAICQAAVTAHGGTISAENLPVGGCRFVVTLPASLLVTPPAEDERKEDERKAAGNDG
ncbi:MAG: DUF4118 domain-containing protein [Alphaproteobacteria bacterium]|nr:DUF4118 domain-containing protein [Alphaproteobacteria bacterium]